MSVGGLRRAGADGCVGIRGESWGELSCWWLRVGLRERNSGGILAAGRLGRASVDCGGLVLVAAGSIGCWWWSWGGESWLLVAVGSLAGGCW